MGVTLSTNSTLAPISLASTIIGFVSFAFTLGTFFKVVWANLTTMGEAPHEVHTFLTNLRTELLEERANLRKMRKGMKRSQRTHKRHELGAAAELDDASFKTMNDNLRHCIKQFRELEKPFLEPGEHGIADYTSRRRGGDRKRRNSSLSPPRYSHGAYSSPPETSERAARTRARGRGGDESWDRDDDEEMFWAQRTNYARFTVKRRFQWLTRKSQAQSLVGDLTRLQLRRVARQVTGISITTHEYLYDSYELGETVRRIDERVSRVIGVRRISE